MLEAGKPSFIKGAAILTAASIFVKIVGAIYKLPIYNILDDAGAGSFQVTYSVYTLILTISVAGIPAALSRLVSSAAANGEHGLVRRYFSVSMPAFMLIGMLAMLLMFFFADAFARLMNNSMAAHGIRVLAPAVFFSCVISVYRGYAQGFEDMIPTAASQVVEVLCKAAFGIAAAMWLVRAGAESDIVSAGAIMGVTLGLGLAIPLLMRYKSKLDRGRPPAPDKTALPRWPGVLGRIMAVSVPITLSASFMAIMVVIDSSIILGRLQSALGFTELEASALFGIYSRVMTIYNLPPSLVVPISISIIPAIAAALAAKRAGEAGLIMRSSVKIVNLLAMPAAAGMIALASPILIALYSETRQLASTMLLIMGAASFFACLQYITTAILQANGHERVALMTFPVGAALKITLGYFLAGNPNIGIVASPIGTLACFIVISSLNIAFILARVKERPKFSSVFVKPLLCSAAMAGAAFLAYQALFRVGAGFIGAGRFAVAFYLAVAISVGVAVYGVLIVVSRTVTMEDMKLVPKGAKLAKLLRVRE